MNYFGTLIEESLENKQVLKEIKILSTKVEPVETKHQTLWLKQWTLHKVEIAEDKVSEVSDKISKLLDPEHNWYADYKNEKWHYFLEIKSLKLTGKTMSNIAKLKNTVYRLAFLNIK